MPTPQNGVVPGRLVWDREDHPAAPSRTVVGGLGFTTQYSRASDGSWDLLITDVGGAWRRDRTTPVPEWVPCDGPDNGPFPLTVQRTYSGAIAPSNPDIAYIFKGDTVYRSSDKGITWAACAGLTGLSVSSPNSQASRVVDGEKSQERLQPFKLDVDPQNDNHILVAAPGSWSGSASDWSEPPQGIWHSRDAGATGAQIPGLPPPIQGLPMVLCMFDPSSPVVGGFHTRAFGIIGGVDCFDIIDLHGVPNSTALGWQGFIAESPMVTLDGRLFISDYEDPPLGIYEYVRGSGWTVRGVQGAPLVVKEPVPGGIILAISQYGAAFVYSDTWVQEKYWGNTRRFDIAANGRTFIGPDRIRTQNQAYIANASTYGDDIVLTQGVGVLKTTWTEVKSAMVADRPIVWEDDTFGQEMLVNNIPSIFTLGDGSTRRFQSSHDKCFIPHIRKGEGQQAAFQVIPFGFRHGMSATQAQDDPDRIVTNSANSSQVTVYNTVTKEYYQPVNQPGDYHAGDSVALTGGQILMRSGGSNWPKMTLDDGATPWEDVQLFDKDGNAVAKISGKFSGWGFSNWTVEQRHAIAHRNKPGVAILYNTGASSDDVAYEGLWESRPNTIQFDHRSGENIDGQKAGASAMGYQTSMDMDSAGNLYLCGGNVGSNKIQDFTVHLARFDTSTVPYTRTVVGTWWNECSWIAIGAPAADGLPDTLWACGWKDGENVLAYNTNRGEGDWQIANIPRNFSQPLKTLASSKDIFGQLCLGVGSLGTYDADWIMELAPDPALGGNQPLPRTAPTLIKTNAVGEPLSFTVVWEEGTTAESYHIEAQAASDAGFTQPLAGDAEIRKSFRPLTMDDFVDNDGDGNVEHEGFAAFDNQPLGTIFGKVRLVQESDDGLSYEAASPWSNAVSATVAGLSDVTWDDDPNLVYQFVTVDPATLTISHTSTNVGAIRGTRATSGRTSGKFYAEFLCTSVLANGNPANLSQKIGLVAQDAATAGTIDPGSNIEGTHIRPSSFIYYNQGNSTDLAGGASSGDRMGMVIDHDTSEVWYTHNGVALNGDPVAGTGGIPFTITGPVFLYGAVNVRNHTNDYQNTLQALLSEDVMLHKPAGIDAYNGATQDV